MSSLIGYRLNDALYQVLQGDDVGARWGEVIQVATVDGDGFAHLAMLSYGEVLARDRGQMRLALYQRSTTTTNIRRNGKVTLVMEHDGKAYYVKGTGREIGVVKSEALPELSIIQVEVTQLLEDQPGASEAGVYLKSGVTFDTSEKEAFLERDRRILALLSRGGPSEA